MIAVGDRVGEATLWTAPNERTTVRDLVSNGRVLLVFYLFDWSST